MERLVTGLVRLVFTGKPEKNLGKLSFPQTGNEKRLVTERPLPSGVHVFPMRSSLPAHADSEGCLVSSAPGCSFQVRPFLAESKDCLRFSFTRAIPENTW